MIILPGAYITDVLSNSQLEFVARHLPFPREATGRPAYPNRILLPGVLKVLRSGCRWRDLNLPGYPDGVTHWRRLRFWQGRCRLWPLWKTLLKHLVSKRKVNLKRACLDGSLVPSFAFKSVSGYSGRHHRHGVKVSCLVDGRGIPLGMALSSGNVHDLTVAQQTIESSPVRLKVLLADKGDDAIGFRVWLRHRGIKDNISPKIWLTRKGRWPFPYDKLLAKKRYVVERTTAWWKSFRRLHFRFDRTITTSEAMFLLGAIVICVRRLIP